jgi:hypothetical protein
MTEAEQKASWERLRSSPWNPQQIRRAFINSGRPRIQLIFVPSFQMPRFWEVCQRGSDWLVYSGKVSHTGEMTVMVQGYELVAFDGDKLQSFFRRIISLELPIAPDYSGMSGVDGTSTTVTLNGDLHSHVQYRWWEKYPAGWEPLVTIANEMLKAFEPLATETP